MKKHNRIKNEMMSQFDWDKYDNSVILESKYVPYECADISDLDFLFDRILINKGTRFRYKINAVLYDPINKYFYVKILSTDYTLIDLFDYFEFSDGYPCGQIKSK